MLARIEKDYFKGAGLAKASLLKGEERRAFRLSQVERLLTKMQCSSPLAVYLSEEFWIADKGRVQYDEDPNPLLSPVEQQTLTEREMARLRLILEIAALCHDLSLHFTFDLKDAFGVRNNFWVSNKQLVEWLSTTEYEHVAMHTAFIMRKIAIDVYYRIHYQPAQDKLAELYSMEYQELVRRPTDTKMPPRAYVRTILEALLQIERHWQRGRRLKLNPEVVILHDEIYGMIPLRFCKGVVQAAQILFDYMDRELYGQLVEKDDRTKAEVMGRFVDKVREVRNQYFAEGWIADNSLEFLYLLAHAERCGDGYWREEDDTL